MLKRLLLSLLGILVVLFAVMAVAVWLIDIDSLVKRYKPQAIAAASDALGRPVELGPVETTWFPGVGVVGRELEVAAAKEADDQDPLIEAEAVRVSVALWPAIISFGRTIEVGEVAVVRPTIHVRQYPDGRSNFSDLGASANDSGPDASDGAPSDQEHGELDAYLEHSRIGQITIEDGVVRYDGQDRALKVENIDLTIENVALGEPVRAELALALASDEQNVAIDVETAPLPTSLGDLGRTDLANATLSIQSLAVASLAPKVEAYDLSRAQVHGDLVAEPVEEALRITGPLRAGPIAWSNDGQQGDAFEIEVQTAIEYGIDDPAIRLDGTTVAVGPVAMSVAGRVTPAPLSGDVAIDMPRPVALAELRPLAAALDQLPATPVSLRVEAHLSPERIRAPFTVELGPSALDGAVDYPLEKAGRLSVGLETESFNVGSLMTDFESSAMKSAEIDVEVSYDAPVDDPADGRATLERFEFMAGRSRMTAQGHVDRLSSPRIRLTGQSPLLDIDALLPPSRPAESEPEDSGDEDLGAVLEGIEAEADLAVEELRYRGVTARDAQLKLEIRNKTIRVKELGFDAFAGRVSASGTSIDFSHQPARFDVKSAVSKVQSSSILGQFSKPFAHALDGRVSSEIDVSGTGFDWKDIRKSLNGSLGVSFDEGKLSGVDLVRAAVRPLRDTLNISDDELGDRLTTDFEDLNAELTIDGGEFLTRTPIRIDTPEASVGLEGTIGLDAVLALDGQVDLQPSFVRALTGGKVRPSEAVPVGVRLGCAVSDPCVEDVRTEGAIKRLGRAALEKVKRKIGDEAKGGVDEKIDDIKEDAKDKLKNLFSN